MFADVTSANIVGYQTITRPQVNFCAGSMFQNCGDKALTLEDFKITGVTSKAACRNCTIVFMESGTTAKFDSNRKFWTDIDGKWRKFVQGGNFNSDPFLSEAEMKEQVINPGEGVICAFNNANAQIVYSGEVIKGEDHKISIPRTQVNFAVVNMAGRNIDLTEVKITGVTSKAACRNCTIVFMESGTTAKFDQNRKFWMDIDGNWRKFVQGGNFNSDPVLTEEQMKEQIINAGQGIVCAFNNANAVIVLPSAL